MDRIYLDYAATSPMRPEALDAMRDALTSTYGNASAVYEEGARAKKALEDAREIVADSVGAERTEIFFTSGGTESDNWALIAAAEALREKGSHIIVSAIEHHAILRTCEYLSRRGFEITELPVNSEGVCEPESLRAAIRPDTILVSVMTANNEVGTIQPVEELASAAHEAGAVFHTDAVQAYCRLRIDVKKTEIDLLSASAHKIGGPKGIGFLYISKNVKIGALMHGGYQERGRRAGTENIPAVIGFAAAVKAALSKREQEQKREYELQRYFLEKLTEYTKETPDGEEIHWLLNGPEPGERRLFGNISISLPGLTSDSMLIALNLDGIACSAGSACTTGAPEPSHVIMGMHADRERALGTLRFSIGENTTEEELAYTAERIAAVARRMIKLQRMQENGFI